MGKIERLGRARAHRTQSSQNLRDVGLSGHCYGALARLTEGESACVKEEG